VLRLSHSTQETSGPTPGYQQYLEAVRDYWTTRSELEGAIDGGLPKETA
jgi:hypothetical protein